MRNVLLLTIAIIICFLQLFQSRGVVQQPVHATGGGTKTDKHQEHKNVSDYSLDYDTRTCTNSSILPEKWCMDERGTPRYVGYVHNKTEEDSSPSKVIQRRYTQEGYENCLTDTTVVFIGDSRVRYQFMNLIDFLLSKQFMKCQDYDSDDIDPDTACYLIDHEHHKKMGGNDWISWYQQSTLMLATTPESSKENYQQSSLCDCYRPDPFTSHHTHENRFIERKTLFGEICKSDLLPNFLGLHCVRPRMPAIFSLLLLVAKTL